MSVKSLTVITNDEGKDVCVLSRDIDGYLTGHGEYLRNFLRGYLITREAKSKDNRKAITKIGRLAALLVAEFKSGIGDFELLPAGTRDQGEEYLYTIYARHSSLKTPSLLNLRVEVAFPQYSEIDPSNNSRMTVIYDGLLDEFDPHEVQSNWEHAEDELDHFVDSQVALATPAPANQSTVQ